MAGCVVSKDSFDHKTRQNFQQTQDKRKMSPVAVEASNHNTKVLCQSKIQMDIEPEQHKETMGDRYNTRQTIFKQNKANNSNKAHAVTSSNAMTTSNHRLTNNKVQENRNSKHRVQTTSISQCSNSQRATLLRIEKEKNFIYDKYIQVNYTPFNEDSNHFDMNIMKSNVKMAKMTQKIDKNQPKINYNSKIKQQNSLAAQIDTTVSESSKQYALHRTTDFSQNSSKIRNTQINSRPINQVPALKS